MDPITFIWEIAQVLFGLVAAVIVPVGGLWLIARRQRSRQREGQRPPTG
jgi:heme/copper-type cytochrome/quinol oxidase subunit 4